MAENFPVLSVTLEEAKRLVEERITLGRNLLTLDIRDKPTLEDARNQYYSWNEYNYDLLKKLIRSDKFFDEYRDRVSYWGGSSGFSQEVQEFCNNDVERKLRRLESIRDRLHLYEPDIPTPTLVIHDEELRTRTIDLLNAPGKYDRVIREATTILEDRIRRKVPFDDLVKLIPSAADQTGDQLINRLLSTNNPIIVFQDPVLQRRLFRMLGAVMDYLRNPSHHKVDDTVDWSWAWSVVGFIDQLLGHVGDGKYQRPTGLS